MSYVLDLISLADNLARESQQPRCLWRQAALRRAVSTAYYALFHHVVARGVGRMGIGQEPLQRAMRAGAARWPDHGKMKTLCQKFAEGREKTTLSASTGQIPGQVPWPSPSAELTKAARAFVDLYDLRQRADYDLASPLTRQTAHQAVTLARDGLSYFDHALLKSKPPDPWASWFFLLVMHEPKQRG